MMRICRDRKSTHRTRGNDRSSRSHTIIQLMIVSYPVDNKSRGQMETSKISFIDLSGAERGVAEESSKQRAEEGNMINKSLFALSKCINALTLQKNG